VHPKLSKATYGQLDMRSKTLKAKVYQARLDLTSKVDVGESGIFEKKKDVQ